MPNLTVVCEHPDCMEDVEISLEDVGQYGHGGFLCEEHIHQCNDDCRSNGCKDGR